MTHIVLQNGVLRFAEPPVFLHAVFLGFPVRMFPAVGHLQVLVSGDPTEVKHELDRPVGDFDLNMFLNMFTSASKYLFPFPD